MSLSVVVDSKIVRGADQQALLHQQLLHAWISSAGVSKEEATVELLERLRARYLRGQVDQEGLGAGTLRAVDRAFPIDPAALELELYLVKVLLDRGLPVESFSKELKGFPVKSVSEYGLTESGSVVDALRLARKNGFNVFVTGNPAVRQAAEKIKQDSSDPLGVTVYLVDQQKLKEPSQVKRTTHALKTAFDQLVERRYRASQERARRAEGAGLAKQPDSSEGPVKMARTGRLIVARKSA